MNIGRSKYADDVRWKMILKWVDEKSKTNPMSMRGAPMEGENGHVYCMASFYTDRECTDRQVFLVSAGPITRNREPKVELRIDGPWDDSGDQYWNEMKVRDDREGNAIVTGNFQHYTISKDRKDPGWGDGHGGQEFTFEVDVTRAYELRELGLKVEARDAGWFLTSRNVWSQGKIPAKHRKMFPPNAVLKK